MPTAPLPPSLASATTCLSSWSSWSSAVTAYTGPYSSGTYSLVTPAVTLTGHLYYTTPAPATYKPPECTFADADICAVLASGVQIIGSAPTTVVVPATTDVLEGDVPAEVLVPSPACSVGQAACSALASAGVVEGFWDGWVVDWRDCVMEPPGIGPVALTTTDFLVAPPTKAAVSTTTGRTTGKTTTGGGRSGSSSPRPTNTKAEVSSGGSGYLVSETELLPGTATGKPEDGKGGGGVVAASQVNGITTGAPPANAQGPHTIDLVISAPNNGGAPPSSTRLTLPPPPSVITQTGPIPVATLAGQTIVFDPAKGGAPSAAVLYVGDFPIREGGPAVNVGGTPVRLLPGGLLLVGAGGKSGSPTTTITLPAAAATTDVPIATIAGMPVYADPARPGAVIVGGETLAPGASVVLDDGKTVWLGGVDGATGSLQLEQVAETMGTGDGAGVTGSSALEAAVTAGGGTTSRSSRQGGSVTATSERNGTVTTSRTTTATTSGDGLEGYTAVPSIPSSTLDVDSSGIRVWTRKVGALFAGLVVAGRMLV